MAWVAKINAAAAAFATAEQHENREDEHQRDKDRDRTPTELHISTSKNRTLLLRVETAKDAKEWCGIIRAQVQVERDHVRALEQLSALQRAHRVLSRIYNSNAFGILVLILIAVNFLLNVLTFEYQPAETDSMREMVDTLDNVLTILFTAEICLNAIVNWFWSFVSSAWNWLDGVIMTVSLYGLSQAGNNSISWLRIFRVLRVVRIVRRLRSLEIITNSLINSAAPLFNALCIVSLVWGLYAVAAVQLYGGVSERLKLGFFATFSESCMTLFQVASGDAWIMTVVRPLVHELQYSDDESEKSLAGSVWPFFVSYYFVSSIVLFNIIVAILLDEFINATATDKFQRRETGAHLDMALDWVLVILAGFSTPGELKRSIQTLFKLFDNEDQDCISFCKLQEGLERIRPHGVSHHIELTRDDWEHITENGHLCDEHDCMDLDGFQVMIRRQLCIFSLRRAATSVKDSEPAVASALMLLKMLLMLVEGDKEEAEDHQVQELGSAGLKKQEAAVRRRSSSLGLGGDRVTSWSAGLPQNLCQDALDVRSSSDREWSGGDRQREALNGTGVTLPPPADSPIITSVCPSARLLQGEGDMERILCEVLAREKERDRVLAALVERDEERHRRDAETQFLLRKVLVFVLPGGGGGGEGEGGGGGGGGGGKCLDGKGEGDADVMDGDSEQAAGFVACGRDEGAGVGTAAAQIGVSQDGALTSTQTEPKSGTN